MTTHVQLNAGAASESFRLMSRRLADERVIARLGGDAASLWPDRAKTAVDAAMASGWNAAALAASDTGEDALRFAGELEVMGFEQAVVLGIGGSAQAARALIALGPRDAGREPMPVAVLDSIVPEVVLETSERIDFEKTLFIAASASGTTMETMLLYRYFRARVAEAVGKPDAARRFAAVTASGSPLAVMAANQGFLRCFECPADVAGRFSSFTHFGLMPAALAGVDVRAVASSAAGMRRACESADATRNPGASLGGWLAAVMREGRDKLTFAAPQGARPLLVWIEQLVAESTGKDSRGLAPVLYEPPLETSSYGDDRAFVRIPLAGEPDPDADRLLDSLSEAGHPVAVFPPLSPPDVGAEMYRWQHAVVTASALTGLWPFDQPDVQASKDMARRIVDGTAGGIAPEPENAEAVVNALRNAPKGSYLAVMAFVQATAALEASLRKLRAAVGETFGMPVMVGYGPEFLHSTGQLHKGGPKSLVGLQIHARGETIVRAPGDSHTFGDILAAQADGDLHVLRDRGLPAFRLRCGPEGPAGAVLELSRAIREAPSV